MCKKIEYKDRLIKYLEVFNAMKYKYTGISSRFSIKNKLIVSAWNKQVKGVSPDDLNEMARDIVKAIYAACHSEWHKENKYKYITPQFFLRQDKMEFWLNEYISNHHARISRQSNKQRFV
jgi:hypothetical protein